MEAIALQNRISQSEILSLINDGVKVGKAIQRVAVDRGFKPKHGRYIFDLCGGDLRKTHGNALLTKQQEDLVLGLLLALSSVNSPITRYQLKKLLALHAKVPVSEATVTRYLKKWSSKIQNRKTKALCHKRVTNATIDQVRLFSASVSLSSERWFMAAENVFNYDETRIALYSNGKLCLERVGKRRAEAKGFHGVTLGSLVPFVSADGKVWMSVYIMAAKKGKEEGLGVVPAIKRDQWCITRKSHPVFFAATKTGYNNKVLHEKILNQFTELWRLQGSSNHCYVFSDQLRCHHDIPIVKNCLNEGVHLWGLPPNTSHFLQPLDDVPFARYKSELYSNVSERTFDAVLVGETVTKEEIISIALDLDQSVFKPRVIQRGFRDTGLWPFDPKKMETRAANDIREKEKGANSVAEACATAFLPMIKSLQKENHKKVESVPGM